VELFTSREIAAEKLALLSLIIAIKQWQIASRQNYSEFGDLASALDHIVFKRLDGLPGRLPSAHILISTFYFPLGNL
jgi:hypothetical protein